ncbi:P-loop NTPase fold protein [Lysobacter sp. 2RAF19]
MDKEVNASIGIRAASGHDAPAFHRAEDIYNRWPLATAISRAIEASPLSWSTRVGLFGAWGEGKTSVLNFLEQQQTVAGNIIIRFSPWGASTEEDVWQGFSRTLRKGLAKARSPLPLMTRAMYWVRRWAGPIAAHIKAAGKIANAKAPGISAGTDFAAGLVAKHVKLSRRDVESMARYIGNRRVIIFVDDLDRTDPAVIPKLLLALRDLLDFSQFAFVLAFDKSIVSKAIEEHNAAWAENADTFLHKIIDFPFEISPPSRAQVLALARDQFEKLCPFVPLATISDLADVIPTNPRKLKLLGRMLATARTEAARHEPGEIKWNVVVLYAMLSLESAGLASDLLHMSTIGSLKNRWLQFGMTDNDEMKAQADSATKDLLARHSQKDNAARIGELIQAWRNNIPAIFGENLRYQARFTVTPHCITWGEFKDFLKTWRELKRSESVTAFVESSAMRSNQAPSDAEKEFCEAVLAHYSAILTQAADVTSGDRHLAMMELAFDTLQLARNVFVDSPIELDETFRIELWTRFYRLVLQWLHFTANPRESDLRKAEESLLKDFASSLRNSMLVYEELKPGHEENIGRGKQEAQLRNAFSQSIQASILNSVCQQALALISEPEQLRRLRAQGNDGLRYLLGNPNSPLFSTPRRGDLLSVLEARKNTDHVIEDSIDYLAFLLASLSRTEQRKSMFLTNSDFAILLWSLVISRPSQFRMLSTLREYRDALLTCGLSETQIPSPSWLDSIDEI